jgi:predicted permease
LLVDDDDNDEQRQVKEAQSMAAVGTNNLLDIGMPVDAPAEAAKGLLLLLLLLLLFVVVVVVD